MSGKADLILVTADDCPACTEYKKYWPQAKLALEELLGPDGVHHINLPTKDSGSERYRTAGQLSGKPGINRYVRWYPTFILASRRSYLDGGVLEAEVFNGQMDPQEGMIFSEQRIPPNAQNLANWIRTETASNLKFQTAATKEAASPILSLLTAGQARQASSPTAVPQSPQPQLMDGTYVVPTNTCRLHLGSTNSYPRRQR